MFSALLYTIEWTQTSHLLVAAVAVRSCDCLTSGPVTAWPRFANSFCSTLLKVIPVNNDPKTFVFRDDNIIYVSRESAEVTYIIL